MRRVFTSLSDLPAARQILNPERGWLSVIVPIARTNLITNPSFETVTTSYTAVGGSIARSTTQQYHGAYSLAVTPTAATTDGVFYGTVSLTSGTTYAASCKIYGAPGVKYKISFATTGGVDLAVYRFVGTGRWQWVWVYWAETSTTTRRIYVTKDTHTSTAVFYIDGVQCEAIAAGETVSTYIDGDQQSLLAASQFPPAYGWNAARHASTSYRTAQTRDGGQVRNLDLFKLFLTGIVGLGIADPLHVVAQQGYTDGAAYQTSLVPSREFSLSGRFGTASDLDLDQQRAALGAALALDATAQRQPVALLYEKYNCLEPTSNVGKIIASYKTGMGYGQTNRIGEDVELPFVQWLPFIVGNDGGAALTQSETITVSTISNLMYRDATGDWSQIATMTGADLVREIAFNAIDGNYYMIGDFTSIGGVSANRIAKYDPNTNTFSALGTGTSGAAFRVLISPEGRVYVGGLFATANGVTVNNITYWDGSTFVALGSGGTKGVDNTVRAITLDASGNLYVAGEFANAGGGAAVRIAKLDTAGTWSALSTGLNNNGQALVTGLDGSTIYVGGTFTTAGGVTVNGVASWNGSAFAALGSGVAGVDVRELRTAPNGDIYVGGGFATASGLTVNFIARWNGFGFSSLGSGVTGGTFVSRMVFGADGLLYVGGAITAVNGITTADNFAAWNGSSWILPDIDMAGNPTGNAIATGPRGELMVFFVSGTASNASAAALNTLTNGGTAVTYPTITITGPSSSTSRLHQIRSYTTGQILSFNLTIFTNELITIAMGPSAITITSNVHGNLDQYVLPGSAPSLPLIKGANSIAVLITGGTVTAVATWPKKHAAVEDLTY